MEKFSLFDLERIDIDELKAQFKSIDGENEYDFGANVALSLMEEGKLEDCPLFSEDDESRKVFLFLLSNTLDEINTVYRSQIARTVSQDMWYYHRIIIIYAIWMEISLPDYEMYSKYTIKYDQGYFDELQRLTTEDLIGIVDNLSGEHLQHICIYNIYTELARRIYDDLDILNSDNFWNKNIVEMCAYLFVLAKEKNDIMKKKEINILIRGFLIDYNQTTDEDVMMKYTGIIFDINPNRENAEYFYNTLENGESFYKDIMPIILISVGNSGQYPRITYESFVNIVRFVLGKYNGSCDDFSKIFIRDREFGKYGRYIISALIRICGNDFSFSNLALKGQIISTIPEGYYK